jgi:hypothetical protein
MSRLSGVMYACPNLICPQKCFRSRCLFACVGAHDAARDKARSVTTVIQDKRPLTNMPESLANDSHRWPVTASVQAQA